MSNYYDYSKYRPAGFKTRTGRRVGPMSRGQVLGSAIWAVIAFGLLFAVASAVLVVG